MSAISRAQLAKELEPGLNALFGLEYDRYENEHAEIFDEETSDRAFEEEVMLAGFSTAPTKEAGSTFSFLDIQTFLCFSLAFPVVAAKWVGTCVVRVGWDRVLSESVRVNRRGVVFRGIC